MRNRSQYSVAKTIKKIVILCYRSFITDGHLHLLRFDQLFGPAVRNVVFFSGYDVDVTKIINFAFLFVCTMLTCSMNS